MKKITIAYFGTPQFAADFLEKMLLDPELPVEAQLVVSQPDRPVGRKQLLSPTPVKRVAISHKISVFDTEFKNVRQEIIQNKEEKSTSDLISKLSGIDIALIYAFGRIIPKQLLALPRFGMWNIHQSILPLYRNVSPISYPLFLGESSTGSTLMLLNDKLDEGDIIAQQEINIEPTDKRSDLETNLTNTAYTLFKTIVTDLAQKNKMPSVTPQDHQNATYTRKLIKQDGFIPYQNLQKYLRNEVIETQELPQIMQEYYSKYLHLKKDFSSSALLYNYFRGMYPWPGIWTEVQINGQNKRLKLTEMVLDNDKITLTKVQLEGKNEVDLKTFRLAYKLFF